MSISECPFCALARNPLVRALQAVLDRHKREACPDGCCATCAECDTYMWPCPTVRAIETALQEDQP